MIIWRGRGCRAALASLRAAGVVSAALALVLCIPAVASARDGAVSDPRELGATLDLKSLTHSDDGSSVVYTAETFAPFTDQSAAFKWGIDRNGDEDFDLIVFTEWRGGKLVGGVKDPAGGEIAAATVSRPGPSVIKVSFPVAALGGAGVYRYAVNAAGGVGGDLAPNAGLSQHRLGVIATPADAQTRPASATSPEGPAPEATPAPLAAPAPVAAAPPAQPVPAPPASLPTTGPEDRALLPIAGAAFMVGGALIAAAPRRARRS